MASWPGAFGASANSATTILPMAAGSGSRGCWDAGQRPALRGRKSAAAGRHAPRLSDWSWIQTKYATQMRLRERVTRGGAAIRQARNTWARSGQCGNHHRGPRVVIGGGLFHIRGLLLEPVRRSSWSAPDVHRTVTKLFPWRKMGASGSALAIEQYNLATSKPDLTWR